MRSYDLIDSLIAWSRLMYVICNCSSSPIFMTMPSRARAHTHTHTHITATSVMIQCATGVINRRPWRAVTVATTRGRIFVLHLIDRSPVSCGDWNVRVVMVTDCVCQRYVCIQHWERTEQHDMASVNIGYTVIQSWACTKFMLGHSTVQLPQPQASTDICAVLFVDLSAMISLIDSWRQRTTNRKRQIVDSDANIVHPRAGLAAWWTIDLCMGSP